MIETTVTVFVTVITDAMRVWAVTVPGPKLGVAGTKAVETEMTQEVDMDLHAGDTIGIVLLGAEEIAVLRVEAGRGRRPPGTEGGKFHPVRRLASLMSLILSY
jgi:hypothetical protein